MSESLDFNTIGLQCERSLSLCPGVFFEYCSKNPAMEGNLMERVGSSFWLALPQWQSEIVLSLLLVLSMVLTPCFKLQTPSRKLQSETEKHCHEVLLTPFFTRLCTVRVRPWVIGCFFLSELSHCAEKRRCCFFPLIHWFVGFSLPTCWGLLWEANVGNFNKL